MVICETEDMAMEQEKVVLTVQGEEDSEEEHLPTYSEDGVDLTLIRWMLTLTPLERLRTAQNYANVSTKVAQCPKKSSTLTGPAYSMSNTGRE